MYIDSEYVETDMMLLLYLDFGAQGIPCVVTNVVNSRDER
jgi:hypothetical protein